MKTPREWLDESIAYYDAGHYQQALSACDVAINHIKSSGLESDLPFAYYCKGRILPKLNRDRDTEAIAFLELANRLGNDACTAPYIELADIHERQGDERKAAACWEEVRKLKELHRPMLWED